jgi:hypothetical protein
VSVFYLRAGYSPDDYQSDVEWQGRMLMESSSAVSCPSVAYQLVGAKKIQQDLAMPGEHAPHACQACIQRGLVAANGCVGYAVRVVLRCWLKRCHARTTGPAVKRKSPDMNVPRTASCMRQRHVWWPHAWAAMRKCAAEV